MPGHLEGGQQPLPSRPSASRPRVQQRGSIPMLRLREGRADGAGYPEQSGLGHGHHGSRSCLAGRTGAGGHRRGVSGGTERRRNVQRSVQSYGGLPNHDPEER